MNKCPRISREYPKDRIGGKCAICNQEGSDTKIEIQVDIFRGNDEVFNIHKACIKGQKRQDIVNKLVEKGIL